MMLLCLILGMTIMDGIVRDDCDIIEKNFYHNEHGDLVFIQMIFWEWSQANQRHEVRDWTMFENVRFIDRPRVGRTVVHFHCHKENRTRIITSRTYRESWTQNDPEREDIRHHPHEQRVALCSARSRNTDGN